MLFLYPEIDGDVCVGGETFKIRKGSGIFEYPLVQKHIFKAKILSLDRRVKIISSPVFFLL